MEAEEFNRSFGRLVRRRREHASLTQTQLAERVGLSRTSIVNIECGRQGIPLHSIVTFADALGCAAHVLLPDRDQPAVTVRMGDHDADASAFISRVVRREGSDKPNGTQT